MVTSIWFYQLECLGRLSALLLFAISLSVHSLDSTSYRLMSFASGFCFCSRYLHSLDLTSVLAPGFSFLLAVHNSTFIDRL